MRLLARVYAGGNTPSKVSPTLIVILMSGGMLAYGAVVVVELYEEEIYGEVALSGEGVYGRRSRYQLLSTKSSS